MAAREEYERRHVRFEYVDVKKDQAGLQRMLEYSGGRRDVPVIVENERVIYGYGGT